MYDRPILYVRKGSNDEFDLRTRLPDVRYLGGLDTSPQITNTYTDNNGVDGTNFNFSTFARSTVTCKFWVHFDDYQNFQAIKSRIYGLFDNRQLIRLRTDLQPNMVIYVRSATFDIPLTEDGGHDSTFSIVFDNPTGYKYSDKKTDEMTDLWDEYPLGYDIPIQDANDYEFDKVNSFQVVNGSAIDVDPYYQSHELNIKLHFAGDSFTITNTTNNSSWTINKHLTIANTILMDGVNTYVDGVLCSDTDFGTITLDKGVNYFVVSGASDYAITFSFPYIYLD